MKPAFALTFSATGISLQHHSDGEWYDIGEVPLSAPDLSDQIKALHDKAFALENDLSCKLVLPADQVRYLALPTEGQSEDQIASEVQAAVAEATPYELADLSYDSATEGSTTFVAAVARETLDEAQAFAAQHGFLPVAYSAATTEAEFPREPVFDLTSEPQVAAPSPEPELESPPVHAIADDAAPTEFRSPDPAPAAIALPPTSNKAQRWAIPAIAALICVGVGVWAWSLIGAHPDNDTSTENDTAELSAPQSQDASPPETDPEPETEIAATPAAEEEPEPEAQPELSPTDAAILEALKVAPTPVEQIAQDPEAQSDIEEVAGTLVEAPEAPITPALISEDDLYLASIHNPDLSSDAIALPDQGSFDTDAAFERIPGPAIAGAQYELDERGLVVPTAEGALSPEGILVYLGRPSKVPPEVPVRFEEEPVVDEVNQRLAELRPRPRPGNLVENFERTQLGGRSLEELAVVRPKLRPESLQVQPEVDDTPTALAVVRVPRPKLRPARAVASDSTSGSNLGSTAAVASSNDEAGSFQPRSVAPKIPTTASVARQATIDNALNLRKLNLIGVYGTTANRRALVRLPSGRYKKLKIGDRIDGGKVIAISDSELRYQKKGRNLTLKMPRG